MLFLSSVKEFYLKIMFHLMYLDSHMYHLFFETIKPFNKINTKSTNFLEERNYYFFSHFTFQITIEKIRSVEEFIIVVMI